MKDFSFKLGDCINKLLGWLAFVIKHVEVIAWEASLDYVGNVTFAAAYADVFQHPIQEGSRGSDEGFLLSFFLLSRSFSDEEDSCVGWADGRDIDSHS